MGANFSNFPLSGTGFLSAVGFLGCISAVIGLYVLYWLQLTMVETLVRSPPAPAPPSALHPLCAGVSCAARLTRLPSSPPPTQVYLAGLGLVTILVGWQALRHRHYARIAASAKDTKRD